MRYLLDTNVISESIRKQPDGKVLSWIVRNGVSSCISAVTIGEIWKGLELVQEPRKQRLASWLKEFESDFDERILSLDAAVMKRWGTYYATQLRAGNRPSYADSLIGATALHYELILVTRNAKDFPDVPVINPWG